MFAATITPNALNVFVGGKMHTVPKSHINFDKIQRLVTDIQHTVLATGCYASSVVEDLDKLINVRKFLALATEGRVQISAEEVLFDGTVVGGIIADRLLAMVKAGAEIRPMARFLERLKQNPDIEAIDDVYKFLESGNMPITPDGCFLAFKYVRDDYYSVHSGRGPGEVRNMIGDTPSMPREEVDSVRTNECSRGLHFCSYQYLGNTNTGNRLMVVKVAPEDVVSIPVDYNRSKGRTWRYAVIDEIKFGPENETRYDDRPVVASEGAYDDTDADYEPTVGEEHLDCDDLATGMSGDELVAYDAPPVIMEVIAEETPYLKNDALLDAMVKLGDEADEGLVCLITGDTTVLATAVHELTFDTKRRKNRHITGSKLMEHVADFGQRGTAKLLKIPRSTIQEWIKRVANA